MTAGKQGQRSGSRLAAHETFIIGLIDAEKDKKDITLNQMVLRLSMVKSVSIGRSALDVRLRKRGWTFKKDRTRAGAGARRPFEPASGMV
jgi:transposase